MRNAFRGISVSGIIKPGNIYIFESRQNREWDAGPIEYMYIIRQEEEILAAIELTAEDTAMEKRPWKLLRNLLS